MNKYELVLKILELCDENEEQARKIESMLLPPEPKKLDDITQLCIELGRDKLYDDITKSWQRGSVYASRNANNEIRVTSFADWLKDFIYRDRIPDHIAPMDMIKAFDEKFHAEYESAKNLAIEALLYQEKEEAKNNEQG